MKRIWLFILIALFTVVGCKSKKKESNTAIITVSILPQKYFTEKIAGNNYAINVLIPPGGSPVTYEATARQMAEISNSLIYFKIGQIEFEKTWAKKITSNNPNLSIIDISRSIDFLEGSCQHNHDHSHAHHHALDPHIWMSPRLVKRIAENIKVAMENMNQKNKKVFSANYEKFVLEIDSIDNYIKNKLSNIETRSFMIFHPALSYYALDYNLDQIAIEIEGKNPSPTHMKSIIDEAKEKNIKVIFIQKQFNIENAKTIAKEIDAEVVQIDPLAYDWKQSMIDITDKLHKALSK